jgi:hypothetical protein
MKVGGHCQVEPLESRRLLSDTWTTVDEFAPAASGTGTYADANDMASDARGGVYAVGGDTSAHFGLVRYKAPQSSQWQTVVTDQGSWFNDVAMAPTGDVYVSGSNSVSDAQVIWKGTWNADGTALSLSVVDSQPNHLANGNNNPSLIYAYDMAIDANDNVFVSGALVGKGGALGTWHWVVRKQTAGQGSFATVDDFTLNGADARANAVTVVPNGAGAGVYVVGNGGGGHYGTGPGAQWVVRKSTNGGSAWTTVDSFEAEPSTNSPSGASAVAADDNGVVHVAGRVSTRVLTGGTKKSPTYRYDHRWYLRSSANGSTWTSQDVFPENVVTFGTGLNYASSAEPSAVTTDQSGNVYVAGTTHDPQTNVPHSVVRSNAGGGWGTSDDFSNAGDGAIANAMTRDASGSIYVGGRTRSNWFVRSVTPAAATATSTVFSTSTVPLSDPDNPTLADELLGASA